LLDSSDLWEEGIAFLRDQASAKGINNMKAIVADLGKLIPLENNSVDICFMATVLHDLILIGAAENAL
jgi:response regulator RpfG family c-di-GMP phosphodiesterase